MQHLGLDFRTLNEKGAFHTAKEIAQQPEIWLSVWEMIYKNSSAINKFLDKVLPKTKRIILTGAGTSAFIGRSLSGVFQRNTKIITDAISTTDLVSDPKDYLDPDTPLLMISFARSGNSPESIAAVVLADTLCNTCFHLIITCNSDGELARNGRADEERRHVITLPSEANDKSLAMTSSYTGMLLAGILISQMQNVEANKTTVDILSNYGRKIINDYSADFRMIAAKDFKRAVFLGSGPLQGTATESHLKLQELTDGRIICKDDSFLGFRHGPKAVVDNTTLVVYIFSSDSYVLKYEIDMVASMKKGNRPLLEIGIMEKHIPELNLDYTFCYSEDNQSLPKEFLSVCSVLPAQLLAFFKSFQLGLRPDSPSETGAISRVVEEFPIYELTDNHF
ncbi:SIS domain-containing protein [Adhaeribacter radiodurans]|uniref:SIS domain-containing protein n=1 Tax=Adhaeribacter radiodurans TaxID=2745197 RepID=A0A7L7L3J1_9BACT|nr:SIS domain-containing protein [Adhaeribacter radiodurans]QMU27382.1 SIS domain-containing protein [Adhaeribacter radiodurans]